MSSGENRSVIWILANLTTLGPVSVDMYLAALPAMSRSLQAEPAAVQLTITAFLIGFGLGPLFLLPISDAAGRRRVLVACIAIFTLMSVLSALAASIDASIVYRFFQALGGGSATTLARAVVRDLYRGNLGAHPVGADDGVVALLDDRTDGGQPVPRNVRLARYFLHARYVGSCRPGGAC